MDDSSKLVEILTRLSDTRNDLREISGKLDADHKFIDAAMYSIERLTGIRNSIKSHGLSKAVLYAADPSQELFKAGIVTLPYGDISDMDNISATSAVENIDAAIEGTFDSIRNAFRKMIDNLKEWHAKNGLAIASHEESIQHVLTKLNEIEIDADRLGKIEAHIFTKSDHDELMKLLSLVGDFVLRSNIFDPMKEIHSAIIDGSKGTITQEKASDKVLSAAKKLNKILDDFGKIHNIKEGGGIIIDKFDDKLFTLKVIRMKIQRSDTTLHAAN